MPPLYTREKSAFTEKHTGFHHPVCKTGNASVLIWCSQYVGLVFFFFFFYINFHSAAELVSVNTSQCDQSRHRPQGIHSPLFLGSAEGAF